MMLWCSFSLVLLLAWAEGSSLGLEQQTTRKNPCNEIPALEAVVEGLIKGYVKGVSEELTALRDKFTAANKVVAFHAHHHSDPFNVASQGTIVYNAVSINIGNGYDSLSGIFTATVAGTYSFFINCMAVTGTSEEPSILVNGVTIATCHSNRLDHTHPFEQGATQGIAHLNIGDKSWVQMQENARDVRGRYWNTFSGFLIRADV